MIFRKLFLALLLLWTCIAVASTTIVTTTVTDPNGQLFKGGTYRIDFRPVPGNVGPYTVNGVPFTTVFTGTIDNTGTFVVTLTDNTTIQPSGSSWSFNICSNSTAPCFTSIQAVHGAVQNLSAAISADAPAIFVNPFPSIPHTYSDAEVRQVAGIGGGIYVNITDNTLRYSPDGVTWIILGNGITITGPVTIGDCVQFSGPNSISDAGAICGSGGATPGLPQYGVQYNNPVGTFAASSHFLYDELAQQVELDAGTTLAIGQASGDVGFFCATEGGLGTETRPNCYMRSDTTAGATNQPLFTIINGNGTEFGRTTMIGSDVLYAVHDGGQGPGVINIAADNTLVAGGVQGMQITAADGSNKGSIGMVIGTTSATGDATKSIGLQIVSNASATVGLSIQANGMIQHQALAFASLPACSATYEGAVASVNNSTTAVWGDTITAGAPNNHVLAYCNGTNWTVAGK